MTTEDKLAAVGNAVKEPKKAKNSEKSLEPGGPGAPASSEEHTQAGEAEQDTKEVEAGSEQKTAPSVAEKMEYKPAKQAASVAAEHHGSHATSKSIGKLMRFRRKRAIRR